MESYVEILGFVAAFLTTTAFVPQAIKTIRTKETHAISAVMYTMVTTGIGLWLIYGLLITSWPLIIANTISFVLSALILGMKFKYG